MEDKAKQIAELLKLLANENRLLILCVLQETPKTVGEIAEHVPGITQSALSQHLGILKAHRILEDLKTGRNVIYSIADHRVDEIIGVLKKYYCDDGAELKGAEETE